MLIKYPFLPKDKDIKYVSKDDYFINEAKKISKTSGCQKQSTGAVLVKNGEIIARGCNAGKKVEVCPRVIKGYKTGEGYHLCKEICLQVGHAEISAIQDAVKNLVNTENANLYLYGHWWCCENCWNAIIKAKIKNVYLLENSHILFNMTQKKKKIYISGALTIIIEDLDIKSIYEKLALVCQNKNYITYVPHLGGTDPINNSQVAPNNVWEKDHLEVSTSDIIIAYVGQPSLGVGSELEIARVTNSKIVLWWFKGERVSRLPKGNPAVIAQVEVENKDDLCQKILKII